MTSLTGGLKNRWDCTPRNVLKARFTESKNVQHRWILFSVIKMMQIKEKYLEKIFTLAND
jgi:hypothetical protein